MEDDTRDATESFMKKGSFSEFLKENGEAILEVAGKELVPQFSAAAHEIGVFDIAGVASRATRRPKGQAGLRGDGAGDWTAQRTEAAPAEWRNRIG